MTRAPRRRRRSVRGALGLAVAVVLVLGACAGDDRAVPATSVAPAPVGIDYSRAGPYQAGIVTLRLPDREVEVVYPAAGPVPADAEWVGPRSAIDLFPENVRPFVPDVLVPSVEVDAYRDVPAHRDGPFPVVLLSHDTGDHPFALAGQARHLASWGMVAVLPRHVERDVVALLTGAAGQAGDADGRFGRDLREAVRLLERENTRAGGVLLGVLDLEHLALVGHGTGAAAALSAAGDDRVDTVVVIAPVAPLPALEGLDALAAPPLAERLSTVTPPAVPTMVLAGALDGVVTLAEVAAVRDWLPPPTRLGVLSGAGHRSLTDTCVAVYQRWRAEQFDLAAVAGFLPVRPEDLASLGDGCVGVSTDPAAVAPVARHLQVAQLRWAFGFDASAASLERSFVEATFPGALVAYEDGG